MDVDEPAMPSASQALERTIKQLLEARKAGLAEDLMQLAAAGLAQAAALRTTFVQSCHATDALKKDVGALKTSYEKSSLQLENVRCARVPAFTERPRSPPDRAPRQVRAQLLRALGVGQPGLPVGVRGRPGGAQAGRRGPGPAGRRGARAQRPQGAAGAGAGHEEGAAGACHAFNAFVVAAHA